MMGPCGYQHPTVILIITLTPVLSAMSHLRFCRATLTRYKVAACNFLVARCDFDAASSESLEAMFVCRTLRQSRSVRLWSRTLRLCSASESRDKIVRQNRRCDMALTVLTLILTLKVTELSRIQQSAEGVDSKGVDSRIVIECSGSQVPNYFLQPGKWFSRIPRIDEKESQTRGLSVKSPPVPTLFLSRLLMQSVHPSAWCRPACTSRPAYRAEMNHHCLQTAGTPSFDHARRSGSHHPGRRRRVVGAAARCKTTAMAWNRLAGHYQELQTFRTKDLSFPRTKGPYGELLFPGNESSWEVSFLGPFVPGNFRSHICVRCFITAV